MTKKELCNNEIYRPGSNITKTEKEKFIEHCMKSKSNNIFPCPEKVLKEIKEQRIIDRHKQFRRIMKF